jgi:uncharacterized Zn finger protein
MMKPTNIKQLHMQSRRLRVHPVSRDTYAVESTTNPAANHIVTVYFGQDDSVHARCTCPWALNSGIACSHVLATLEYLASRKGRRLSFWLDEADARRQKHRTFRLIDAREEGNVWITSRAGTH